MAESDAPRPRGVLSITNVCFGIILILVPILIVDEIAVDEGYVGVAFAIAGIVGAVSAAGFGRINTLGREHWLVAGGCAGMALTAVFLGSVDRAAPAAGLVAILVTMVVFGITNGIWDIGIFTLRSGGPSRRWSDEPLRSRWRSTSPATRSGPPSAAC